MGLRFTEEEYQRLLRERGGADPSPVLTAPPKRSRFNARRTEVEPGITMASKLQAHHYRQLVLLRQAQQIVYFSWEVPLRLPGGVKHVIDWMVVVRLGEPLLWADSKGKDLTEGRAKRKQVRALSGIEIQIWDEDVVI